MSAYLSLLGAIIFEVAGTLMLPLTKEFSEKLPTFIMSICYFASFYFLTLALRTIPLAIVYACWSGLGVLSIAVLSYSFKYKINFRHLIDSFSPALILAYGIGRIGCQMSGDGCWGTENNLNKPDFLSFLPDWMWSYNFPHNVNKDGVVINECNETLWNPYCYELSYNVWPTSFYETIMSFIIFLVLWNIRKKITVSGALFFIYLIFNGIERFIIENLRDHQGLEKYDIFGGIYQAQIISFSLIIVGLSGILYLYKTKISNKFLK